MKEAMGKKPAAEAGVPGCPNRSDGGSDSRRFHWPEYLMEAGELGLFMFSVCVLATLFRHPFSSVSHLVVGKLVRRLFIGLATGAMVVMIVLTPWGKQVSPRWYRAAHQLAPLPWAHDPRLQ
jgi:hypothetical protein